MDIAGIKNANLVEYNERRDFVRTCSGCSGRRTPTGVKVDLGLSLPKVGRAHVLPVADVPSY